MPSDLGEHLRQRRGGRAEAFPAHHGDRREGDRDVQHGGDDDREHQGPGHVPGRIHRLFGELDDLLEADVGEEDQGRRPADPGPPRGAGLEQIHRTEVGQAHPQHGDQAGHLEGRGPPSRPTPTAGSPRPAGRRPPRSRSPRRRRDRRRSSGAGSRRSPGPPPRSPPPAPPAASSSAGTPSGARRPAGRSGTPPPPGGSGPPARRRTDPVRAATPAAPMKDSHTALPPRAAALPHQRVDTGPEDHADPHDRALDQPQRSLQLCHGGLECKKRAVYPRILDPGGPTAGVPRALVRYVSLGRSASPMSELASKIDAVIAQRQQQLPLVRGYIDALEGLDAALRRVEASLVDAAAAVSLGPEIGPLLEEFRSASPMSRVEQIAADPVGGARPVRARHDQHRGQRSSAGGQEHPAADAVGPRRGSDPHRAGAPGHGGAQPHRARRHPGGAGAVPRLGLVQPRGAAAPISASWAWPRSRPAPSTSAPRISPPWGPTS